uniref:Insulin-like growth factor-binding protein 5 n=1 Tax=Cyprinus carpio TaxID=7962 RepID=A0A8C2HRY7_CYPCA
MLLSLYTLMTFVWGLPVFSASYVPCEPCDQKAMSMCPPVRMGCQVVKEPGCGRCLTCALTEGQACGVYTGTCGHGLRCLPRNGEEKPLHALLYGKGVCMNEKLHKPLPRDRESHEDTHVTEDLLPQAKVPLFQRDHINSKKAQAMRKDQKRQEAKLRIRGNSESPLFGKDKHQPDIGPCRRKMDGIIQRMKDNSRIMALSLYLPNCDKKGFFKRKQCKPSRGRKRGICWCVNKHGIQMPGTDFNGGNIQCKDLESNSSNE